MTYDDWNNYWVPAVLKVRSVTTVIPTKDGAFGRWSQANNMVAEIFGIPLSESKISLTLTDEQKSVLRALAGEHCLTVMKMLEARKQ